MNAIPLSQIKVCVGTSEHSDNEEDDDDQCCLQEEDGETRYAAIEDAIFKLSEHFHFQARIHMNDSVGVYAAKRKSDERLVCIKIVNKKYHFEKHAPIELRVLTHLNTTYPDSTMFPTLLHYFDGDETYALVMNLVHEDSFSRCVFGKMAVIESLFLQLLVAVSRLHACGIICRDVKASNLLWTQETSNLVLCDFDLSTFITSAGHTAVVGTDGYMAPEITAFERYPPLSDTVPVPYHKAVDAYACGAVLGSLLHVTSECDIEQDSVFRWRAVLRAASTPPTTLEVLFLGLTDPCPQQRFTVEDALSRLQQQ